MNPLIHLKQTTPIFLILLALGCFSFLPQMQAAPDVVPTPNPGGPNPDGCLPNFTTAEGCNALNMLTSGEANTGLGWRVLYSVGVGNFNTGVGAGALSLNIGDDNTAVGAAALILNIPGTDNTAVGSSALQNNFSGAANTAVGSEALLFNDASGHGVGNDNTAVGAAALSSNDDGADNTAVGFQALFNNVDGAANTAFG